MANERSRQRYQPRYRELAEQLTTNIASGALQVGDRLPGELDMSRLHGVSRHTVREALRLLEERGLVGRRPGVGTVVRSTFGEPAFVQRIVSVSEMLAYPADTRLHVHEASPVRVEGELARALDCAPGVQRIRVRGVRRRVDDETAVCWTDVYLLPHCAGVVERIGRDERPVYKLVEQHCAEHAEEVTVHLHACGLEAGVSEALGVAAHSPALRVVRHYRNAAGVVFETSVSYHPAERFSYTLHLRGNTWEPAPAED